MKLIEHHQLDHVSLSQKGFLSVNTIFKAREQTDGVMYLFLLSRAMTGPSFNFIGNEGFMLVCTSPF